MTAPEPAAALVVVVTTSPRVAAGLLPAGVWDLLRSRPVAAAPGHPQAAALAAEGIQVQELGAATLEDVRPLAPVAWLAAPDDDPTLKPAALTGRDGVAVLQGSTDLPGARLLDAVAVMDRLRSPGGCPWDAEQTHTSLMPYLLEEAYEAYEALEIGDDRGLREELGDVLLQVVFHARIAASWDIDDVAGDLVDKLVRRHPHVFAGADATDLEGSWEALKRAEKGRTSVTDGVPMGQPALSLARTLQSRGSRLGAPVPSYDGVGGQLWALVARARQEGVDPEQALRVVARAYRDRLAGLEQQGLPGTALEGEQEWS